MGIYLVLKNEFIRSLKNKKKLIITLIFTIITIIFSVGVNSIMKPTISLGIIDKSINNNFKEKAEEIEGVKVREANENEINSEMIMGKYLAVIEFKEDNAFTVKSLDSSFKNLIEKTVDGYISTGEINGLKEVLEKTEEESLTTLERCVGFITLTLMITSTINLCNLLKDKDDGILKRFNISPRKKFEYLLGLYLYNLLFSWVQIFISVQVLSLLKINIGVRNFLILGSIISLVASSFGLLIVCLLNDELKASLISASISMLIALVGGAFIPISKMPDALQKLSNGSVMKWLIDLGKLMENNFKFNIEITPIIIICVISIASILISIKIGIRKFA